jgi:serine/threonine protein kinase
MNDETRAQLEAALEAVRQSWESGRESPNWDMLLTPALLADESALAEVLTADARERASRGVAANLSVYRKILPDLFGRREVCRALLMHEMAGGTGATALKARWPELAEEIDLCSALVELIGGSVEQAIEDSIIRASPGVTLGKYRIINSLGKGSFGEVWHAWDNELERYVALKLLYPQPRDESGRTFERVMAEARAAAALAHENVVTVHAAGELAGTRRFYIDSALVGDPDPTASDAKRVRIGESLDAIGLKGGVPTLPPREAARMIEAVCRGVAAAHARGILHRDVKPSNIIVTPSGRPLIADFGLSTSGLDIRESAGSPAGTGTVSLVNKSGRIVGTPAYMSPEQAAGERATPLSDVYGLGATLRFLLTGSPPYKPSGRHSTDARWDVIAQARTAEAEPIDDPAVPRVLAAVCARAMARRPEDRYESAAAMADDLRAFLESRPTLALPPGPAGRAGLWYRRNWLVATLAAAALVGAAAGAGAYVASITLERDRAARERDRAIAAEKLAEERLDEAQKQARIAEATADFLDGMLAAADPRVQGKDVTVLSALARSGVLIDQRLKDQPEVEAAVRTTIGRTYRTLQDIKAARPQLDRAIEIRTAAYGPDDPRTLASLHESAVLLAEESRTTDAAELMKSVLAKRRKALGDDHPSTMESMNDLGQILAWTRDIKGAEAAYGEAVERRARVFGAEDRRTLASKRGWAGAKFTGRKVEESEPIMREVVEAHRRSSDPTDVERLNAINDLGVILRQMGRRDEALPLIREAFEALSAQMPKGHIDTISSGVNMIGLMLQMDQAQAALAIAERLRDEADSAMGEENTFRHMTHIMRGACLTDLGRFDEAEAELIRAYEAIVKVIGPAGRTSRTAATRIVTLYEKWGKPDKAEQYRPLTVPPAPAPAPKPEDPKPDGPKPEDKK